MGFFKLFVAFALAGLFALSMIGFGSRLASDNNANSSILDEPTGMVRDLNSSLTTQLGVFQPALNETRVGFESDLPTGVGDLIWLAIISGLKIFTSLIVGVFNLLFVPVSVLLGSEAATIVLGVLASIVLLGLILFAWRVAKQGE